LRERLEDMGMDIDVRNVDEWCGFGLNEALGLERVDVRDRTIIRAGLAYNGCSIPFRLGAYGGVNQRDSCMDMVS
jgi:hypothetical protein